MQLLYCVESLDITNYKYVDFGGKMTKWLNKYSVNTWLELTLFRKKTPGDSFIVTISN